MPEGDPLTLASNGLSDYVIVHAQGAPESVSHAAQELQRILQVATGVKLPIQNEAAPKMICLGDHPAARSAGIDAAAMPEESFRILTKGNALFIAGKDDRDGEEKWKPQPDFDTYGTGLSRGTLFGVYSFLQDTIGVRWLMPGEAGEDIPNCREGLKVSPIDRTEGPFFFERDMVVGNMKDAVMHQWFEHMRFGGSIATESSHSFDDMPSPTVLKAHPEYMAGKKDGSRVPPYTGHKSGVYPTHKYCMTNPGLIDAFAASVTEKFDKSPNRECVSVSPSDGAGWCEDEACSQFVDRETDGPFGDFGGLKVSYTPLVLNFYNEIAKRVAKTYPDRLIGGYVYHEYVYPPLKPVKIEPNVFLEMAISGGYGYKFYQPKRAEDFKKLAGGWSKITPNLGWTDYSIWMRDAIGAPLPPGLEILKLVFGTLGDNHFKKVSFYGAQAWGYGAATNYLAAQLMWNPKLDIDKTYDDFMNRYYGPAAPQIKGIYDVVEKHFKAYILSKPRPDHELWYDSIAFIYQPILKDIERLYNEADAQKLTENQRRRLEMFKDNLLMLHFNMRNAGLVENPEASSLYLSDADFQTFIRSKVGSLSVVNLDKWAKGQERYGRVQMQLWGPDRRTLDIKAVAASDKSPVIDGDLADPAWSRAEEAGDFRLIGSRNPTSQPVHFKMLHDDKFLYIAVTSAEKPGAKLRQVGQLWQGKGDNRRVLGDDRVEILIANRKLHPGNYWRIAINPANAVWDIFGNIEARNTGVQTASKVTQEAWFMECAIPLAPLGINPAEEISLTANIGRFRADAPLESSSWCSVEERFESSPQAFGTLVVRP